VIGSLPPDAGNANATTSGSGGSGGGLFSSGSVGSGGALSGSDASADSSTLTFVVRDFRLYDPANSTTNPDFENVPKADANGNPSTTYFGPWDDKNVVEAELGADSKPVYQSATPQTLTTHGKAFFDQWYRDVAGTNVRIEIPFTLTPDGSGQFGYDSQVSGVPLSAADPTKQFLPIDDGSPYASPFGDQGDSHNYSFTCEIHTVFTYHGGESLHYRGDDDVWVFVNGHRVIDLGGIHGPETADISLDSLGLVKGSDYPLDFFFAERHKPGSNVLFTTSLALRAPPR
jgi:fibro-slime domain-containing protein